MKKKMPGRHLYYFISKRSGSRACDHTVTARERAVQRGGISTNNSEDVPDFPSINEETVDITQQEKQGGGT